MQSILQTVLIISALTLGNVLAGGIFVGSPTCPAPPGCPVFGNEVNGISGNTNTYTLDQATGTSGASLTGPVLLIIGVPNLGGTYSAPTITLSMGSGVLGGPPLSGLNWNSTTGFARTMTSGGPITDAYQALGLSDPASNSGNSESFANWSAADSALKGLITTNFGVYVYELSNTGLIGHHSSVNVTFGSELPVGTFVVAYGCASSFPCSGGDIYATPFTQSGLNVAEPTTLSVLATDLFGFVGLVFVARRRLRVSISR